MCYSIYRKEKEKIKGENMFKTFIVPYNDLPPDVNHHIFDEDVDQFCADYLVIRLNNRTIYCAPDTNSEKIQTLMKIMDLTYHLGILEGIQYEQNKVI